MKKKIIWIVVLLVSHMLFFIGGSTTGKHVTMNQVIHEADKADAQVALGLYTIYRDIAKDIKYGKYDDAKCSAELGASSQFDDMKSCLARTECRSSVENEIRKHAPEVLDNAPLEFTYLKSKDGIRRCTQ